MSESKALAIATRLLNEYIVCRKMRQTAERISIMQTAVAMPSHFSAASIYDTLVEAGKKFSLTTVYSTLSLLVDAGILRRLSFDGQTPLYERSAAIAGNSRTRRTHHHLICTCCGRITEFRDPDISAEIIKQALGKASASFEPAEISVTVYGLCGRCAKRRHQRPSSRHTSLKDNSSNPNTNHI